MNAENPLGTMTLLPQRVGKYNLESTYAKVHDPTPLVLNASPDVTIP